MKKLLLFLKSKKRKLKLKRLKKKLSKNPLREFVYLDEISIYSLFSSRVGAIATDFTEARSKNFQLDSNVLLGTSEKSIPKKEAKAGAMFNYGQNTQILRKASVQSTFKEFYDFQKDTLLLIKEFEPTNTKFKNPLELLKSDISHNQNALYVNDISRGDLLELEVQLDAEHIYKFNTIFEILNDLISEDSNIIPNAQSKQIEEFREISGILSQLLSGIVPIKCKVLNYSLLNFKSQKYIIHNDFIKDSSQINLEEFNIVGVVDQKLFWKDLRHVLFDNDKYTILCRITKPNISNSWTSVKSMSILQEIAPEISQMVQSNSNNVFKQSFSNPSSNNNQNNEQNLTESFKNMLFSFANEILKKFDLSLNGHQIEILMELIETKKHYFNNHSNKLIAFKEVYYFLESSFDSINLDPNQLVELREYAYSLHSDIDQTQPENKDDDTISNINEENYLECEIIAIYW